MCKGGENSVNWGESIGGIVNNYIDKGNQYRSLRSLVATIINNVSKEVSTRAECTFSLSGGSLKRFSYGFTRIC